MTKITRGKDVGGASGGGNDGSFASKGQTAAEVALTADVTPIDAIIAEEQQLKATIAAARTRLADLSVDAITLIAQGRYPNTGTIVIEGGDDEWGEGEWYQVSRLKTAAGDVLWARRQDAAGLRGQFGRWESNLAESDRVQADGGSLLQISL